MSRRTRRRWWLCVAAAMVLAGCAGDDESSEGAGSTIAAAEVAASVEPTGSASSTEATPPVTAAATAVATTEPVPTSNADTTSIPRTDPPTTAAPTSTTGVPPSGPLTVAQLLDLGRPIVLAHAAGEDQHPHSSPFGYAESVAAGVDMLDFDVQLTADGVLVVQHDDTTGRTANSDLVVAAASYDELHALDNGYWFTVACVCTDQPPEAYIYRGIRTGEVAPPPGYTPEDFAIARFSDIAQRFPDLPVQIEIKGAGEPAIAAARQLALELADLELLDNAVVSSFDDAVMTAFHEFAPTVEISPGLGLSSEWVLNDVPLPDGMRILQLPPQFGDIEVLSAETMTKSHAAGYVVWVWPNDRSLENATGYQSLLERGMDGLNINFPALGVEAVEAFAG